MKLQDGVIATWSSPPDHWTNKRVQTKQEIGQVRENFSSMYKIDKGSVTVKNKFISVTVYDDGRIEINPHEQTKELL